MDALWTPTGYLNGEGGAVRAEKAMETHKPGADPADERSRVAPDPREQKPALPPDSAEVAGDDDVIRVPAAEVQKVRRLFARWLRDS